MTTIQDTLMYDYVTRLDVTPMTDKEKTDIEAIYAMMQEEVKKYDIEVVSWKYISIQPKNNY